ncbi:sulfate ABC transporter substrate-binding protein [Spirochaeta cellobiosiphila]|uniref:sulfate ABC transporter substrate-binding protein n=1 Tax=Spirochaeta cellobiosiphila TaxID=504483 RepID=UPI000402D363|nr:sulfate ABC transporter substrate-binding protein [Spirochaeta cellobiosiphila]
MGHKSNLLFIIAIFGLFISCSNKTDDNQKELLHVSYDIAREIFKNENTAFEPWYKEKTGVNVKIEQSHAGSSRQARSVVDGVPADLVSMNQFLDIDMLYQETKDSPEGSLIPKDWYTKYPNNSNPYSSTMAFVVRKGNPKNIKDWSDLERNDIQIVAPNYKSTGNGRFSYLSAWAWGLKESGNNQNLAREYVKKVLQHTILQASGGRAATNAFVSDGLGDVLLTFESEVNLIARDLGDGDFEVVVPSYGIDAKMYVVVVEKNAKEKGNLEVAKAYWDFLYTKEGQEIVAQSYYRPYNKEVAAEYANQLPTLDLFEVEDVFGGWKKAKEVHFAQGGTYDQIQEELGNNQ